MATISESHVGNNVVELWSYHLIWIKSLRRIELIQMMYPCKPSRRCRSMARRNHHVGMPLQLPQAPNLQQHAPLLHPCAAVCSVTGVWCVNHCSRACPPWRLLMPCSFNETVSTEAMQRGDNRETRCNCVRRRMMEPKKTLMVPHYPLLLLGAVPHQPIQVVPSSYLCFVPSSTPWPDLRVVEECHMDESDKW